MKSHDWRYLAGLWDGEGGVTIANQRRKRKDGSVYCYWQFRLHMTSTSEKLVRSLCAEFGGAVYINPHTYGRKWKPQNQWLVSNSADCLRILTSILPFLRYKADEARLAIEYFSEVAKHRRDGSVCLPDNEVKRRNRIVDAIRNLPGRRKRTTLRQPERMEVRPKLLRRHGRFA